MPERRQPPTTLERSVTVGEMEFRAFSTAPPPTRGDQVGAAAHPVHVLVHGIGASHRYLSRLHAELALHGEVHSIDLPGFGGLPKPGHSPSVAEMAKALGAALDLLGVPAGVLLGHSMGAQWVVELAVQRPDRATGVVIIGPVADDRHRSLPAQALALGIDILVEPPDVDVVVLLDYLRCGPAWFLRQSRPMLTYPIERRVADLAVPLLVMRGGLDPIAGIAWCRRLRDRAADGRLAVVPGHHHVVQHTAPRAVASAVLSLGAGAAARATGT
ncbi:alpha/beta hydrolase [Herbiconiux sp. CPCC 203407]|uniref:Alpha/beta hydrolase n=1 Tax=Herbiconiux oxytropis TaxID=2970915 RepID=A0AA41XAY1_9MICO|nr:alpha/beta hydrolase [Herbiconiux oxytropis]MCS5720789.1 alpha/beta hydrolase [Herbiconiux oxytropis]MCS5724884.1 alpha/beta hydrolase [Herbiconiux oxytropis]